MSATYDPTAPTARDRLRHDLMDTDVSLVGDGSLADPVIIAGGSGYLTTPAVSFTGGTFTVQAAGRAVLGTGAVTGIIMDARGAYTVLPAVTFTGGSPTIAATATVDFATNALNPNETYDAYINLYGEDEAKWRIAATLLAYYAQQPGGIHLDDGTQILWRERVNAWEAIVRTWAQYSGALIRGRQKPLVGKLAAVTILDPPPDAPFDGNDQIYRGTPYGRRFW